MAVAQRMSEQEYETFVQSHPGGRWELHDGVLVEKPGMSWRHLDISFELGGLMVLVRGVSGKRVKINYTKVVAGKQENYTLYPGDTIVVP